MVATRPEKLARRSHPETSTRAAEQLIDSGNLSAHEAAAMDLVREFPGKTGGELDKIAVKRGWLIGQIRKRLGGLANKNELRRGERRACGVKGSRCVTWYPVIEVKKNEQ